MSDRFRFTSSDGLELEGEWDAPDDPRAILVLCHPHPKMGGTMNAPLLIALRDAVLEDGWAVLRFNFRGNGASDGESSTGVAEVADAAGAIAEARRRSPGAPVAVAGWSFGGAVALRIATEDRDLVACATVAPSIDRKPEITEGAPPPDAYELGDATIVICGVNDDQVSPESCRRWAQEAGATYVEMKGANHFFWAKYEPLAAEVRAFLERALAASR